MASLSTRMVKLAGELRHVQYPFAEGLFECSHFVGNMSGLFDMRIESFGQFVRRTDRSEMEGERCRCRLRFFRGHGADD